VTGLGLVLPGYEPDLAAAAEQHGFATLWVMDGGASESCTLLGAIAARTATARLGVLVTDVGHRNPAIVAKQATTIDVISHGRALLAIGGADAGRVEEALTTCRAMFRDEQPSEDARVAIAFNRPVPVQPGGPPVLVAGHLELAARHADGVVIGCPSEDIDRHLALLARCCGEFARDPGTLSTTWLPPAGYGVDAALEAAAVRGLDGVIVDVGPVDGTRALAAVAAEWQKALREGR
jgi:alkanesulfonate monooxygenase SsuD/methylene tetrahydromethanopterin reductase-like flavin-dependent oxidoreductase (luciferase family)